MKILILTKTALKKETSTGLTTQYLFSWARREDLINVYCREERPNIDMCDSFYCIPENLLTSFFLKSGSVGFEFKYVDLSAIEVHEKREESRYKRLKKIRLFFFLWVREIIWFFSKKKWFCHNLKDYLVSNKPDFIYMPIYDCFYMHRILKTIQEFTGAKVVLYSGDDFFSFNFYHLSPFYYINQILLRKCIRKTISLASSVMCFSNIECELYRNLFGEKVYQIYKGHPLSVSSSFSYEDCTNKNIIKILYAGNLEYGRISSILCIGETLDRINFTNHANDSFILYVYSQSSIPKRILRRLNQIQSVVYGGAISREQLLSAQDSCDLLLNVESLRKKDISRVKASFSTKIVDYLFSCKCILSFGSNEVNSISYLTRNDATLYASNQKELFIVLNSLSKDKSQMRYFAEKAFELGRRNHDIRKCSESVKRRFLDEGK